MDHIDQELEQLMATSRAAAAAAADTEPRKKMFTYEVGEDDRGAYLIRIDGEQLLWVLLVLYGVFLGSMLAGRG